MMWFIWIPVIFLIIVLLFDTGRRYSKGKGSLYEILKKRLVKGEITKKQYEDIKSILKDDIQI